MLPLNVGWRRYLIKSGKVARETGILKFFSGKSKNYSDFFSTRADRTYVLLYNSVSWSHVACFIPKVHPTV